MKIYYDNKVDALYIELRPLKHGTAISKDLNEDITGNFGVKIKIEYVLNHLGGMNYLIC